MPCYGPSIGDKVIFYSWLVMVHQSAGRHFILGLLWSINRPEGILSLACYGPSIGRKVFYPWLVMVHQSAGSHFILGLLWSINRPEDILSLACYGPSIGRKAFYPWLVMSYKFEEKAIVILDLFLSINHRKAILILDLLLSIKSGGRR